MGRGTCSGSSPSMDSRSSPPTRNVSSSSCLLKTRREILSTDLGLGLSISTSEQAGSNSTDPREEEAILDCRARKAIWEEDSEQCNENNIPTLYVKVYMEGMPIGRKLDLLARDGYHDLIRTLHHMFNTKIGWGADMDGMDSDDDDKCHVLTYEDEEGDWMMVGDVPWEMFLSTVKRLRITSAFPT